MKISTLKMLFAVLAVIGFGTFGLQLAGPHAGRAWQAYLINFLLFSAIAQGAFLFSTLMNTTKARWSGPLSDLSEAFVAFFPVSLALFAALFLGGEHVFPWLHEDLHGKENWLNLPFLFGRNLAGLVILYGLGTVYALQARRYKRLGATHAAGTAEAQRCKRRMNILSVMYLLAFAIILSLVGFDLVMATDPHWYSTLFGAYTFIKAVYMGFGALIILAAVLHLSPRNAFELPSSNFHDLGKLFFAFCLVWADFFYAQLVVIWYGNISEETAYVIERTMQAPWNILAWSVFTVCFIIPFLVLLNRRVKTLPRFMMVFCALIIVGMWFEHLLLVGPSLSHQATSIPFGLTDVLITIGFFGLMALALTIYFSRNRHLLQAAPKEVHG